MEEEGEVLVLLAPGTHQLVVKMGIQILEVVEVLVI
jgi:hypothetical protein